jgi:superfamily II DNA/RNA helicase
MSRDLERVARERLGFERLRPGQQEAVEALVSGRDVLAVMPTGYGKSAIYQLAGLPGRARRCAADVTRSEAGIARRTRDLSERTHRQLGPRARRSGATVLLAVIFQGGISCRTSGSPHRTR